jgi:malonyl-CoA/methylmalonyl-CoA synthetase
MSRLLDKLVTHAATGRIAVLDEAGAHSHADVLARACAIAAHLGPRHGQRVALLASPGVDFVSALFGILQSGACGVVLSPLHPPAESTYFCDDAGIDTILVTPDQQARAEVLGKRTLVDVTRLSGGTSQPILVGDAEPALMLYTSGTTGRPKGAVLSHENLCTQQDLLQEAWGWSPDDVLLHTLPLHHMHGLCIALLAALGAGAGVRTLPHFDAARVFDTMAECTVFMAVPTIYAKLLGAFDAADGPTRARWTKNASSLRLATSGSAALPVTLAERWRAITGSIPLERFGMTEIGVGISNPLRGERRAGTVGLPLPTVETRIENGELWVRGPSVFAGYFQRDDATRAAFEDGWFKTGDTVARDDDGYFRILGRTSVDILKSGGYKLSALEIEEVLREHGSVADVAVVGVPDEVWGDRVVACVERRGPLEAEELRAFAKDRLASYKCPKDVLFFDALPRNAMGKVAKPELARLARDRLAQAPAKTDV